MACWQEPAFSSPAEIYWQLPESCRPEAWQAAKPPGSLPKVKKSESSISSILLEGGQLLGTDLRECGLGGARPLPDVTDVEIETGVGK